MGDSRLKHAIKCMFHPNAWFKKSSEVNVGDSVDKDSHSQLKEKSDCSEKCYFRFLSTNQNAANLHSTDGELHLRNIGRKLRRKLRRKRVKDNTSGNDMVFQIATSAEGISNILLAKEGLDWDNITVDGMFDVCGRFPELNEANESDTAIHTHTSSDTMASDCFSDNFNSGEVKKEIKVPSLTAESFGKGVDAFHKENLGGDVSKLNRWWNAMSGSTGLSETEHNRLWFQLANLQKIPYTHGDLREVIVVDHRNDLGLMRVDEMSVKAIKELKNPSVIDCAMALVKVVAEKMGGDIYTYDFAVKCRDHLQELKNRRSSLIIPIGEIEFGMPRHRALLFKCLADAIRLQCKYRRIYDTEKNEEGCIVLIQVADRFYSVNLFSATITLIEVESNRCEAKSETMLNHLSPFWQPTVDILHTNNLNNGLMDNDIISKEHRAYNTESLYYGTDTNAKSTCGIDDDFFVENKDNTDDRRPAELVEALKLVSLGFSDSDSQNSLPIMGLDSQSILLGDDGQENKTSGSLDPAFSIDNGNVNVQPHNSCGYAFKEKDWPLSVTNESVKVLDENDANQFGNVLENERHNGVINATAISRRRKSPFEMASYTGVQPFLGSTGKLMDALPERLGACDSLTNSNLVNEIGQESLNVPCDLSNGKEDSALNLKTNVMDAVGLQAPIQQNELAVNSRRLDKAHWKLRLLANARRHSDSIMCLESSKRDGNRLTKRLEALREMEILVEGSCEMQEKESISSESSKSSKDLQLTLQKLKDEYEIQCDDIRISSRIGIGSYGEVYRGTWVFSDVAVKFFNESDMHHSVIKDFLHELNIMKRLHHANVLMFLGYILTPHVAIVTQYMPRGSLFKLLHRHGSSRLDSRRRLCIAIDVARGMHYLHSRVPPIIHRDLKSPNLLVDKDFTVKVSDFGLSKLQLVKSLSVASHIGTPEWSAPEVLRSQEYDESSDSYSYGVILWELLTNKIPWHDRTPMQVVGTVGWGEARLPIPANSHPDLVDLIKRCWSTPKQRPTFSDILEYLLGCDQELFTRNYVGGPKLKPASSVKLDQRTDLSLTCIDEGVEV